MIKTLYSPKATDLMSVLEGKFNALEEFVRRGEEKAEKFQRLYEQCGEDIPVNELLQYQKESEALIDDIIAKSGTTDKNSNGVPDQAEIFEELPNPKDFTGQILDDEETGKSYKSDGKKWTLVRK